MVEKLRIFWGKGLGLFGRDVFRFSDLGGGFLVVCSSEPWGVKSFRCLNFAGIDWTVSGKFSSGCTFSAIITSHG